MFIGIAPGSVGESFALSSMCRASSCLHKRKTDVPVDEPQQMSLRNLIYQAEVVEQRFGADHALKILQAPLSILGVANDLLVSILTTAQFGRT
jgi:hypothetical protein